MKIEVIIKGGFMHEGVKYEAEDVKTVSDELGDYFCRAGWAKDLSGVVPTATPNLNETVLLVENNNHSTAMEIK